MTDKLTGNILEILFLAWTTTRSLVGNMGLGVNSEISYCCVKYNNEYYYLAENLITSNFKEELFK